MKASQIYNTKQASNSQQVLLYSNRSPAIIVLVRESRTKPPKREREREQRRAAAAKAKMAKRQKKRNRRQLCSAHSFFPAARRSSQRSLSKIPTFFLEDPNVLSRSFQRSFSAFQGSFSTLGVFVRSRGCYFASAFPHCSLPTFFLEVPSILSRHSDQRSSVWTIATFFLDAPRRSLFASILIRCYVPYMFPPSSPVQVPYNRSP